MFLFRAQDKYKAGFTLIELMMVILVIGIIAVNTVPRWNATGTNLNYEARRVLNDIRFAQGLSLNSGLRYRWVRLSANTYQITNEAGVAVLMPTGGTVVTLAAGATFGTLTNLPNNLIAFNSQGTPYTDSTYATALASTASVPLTVGGITRTVQVSATTGYGVLA